LVNQLFVLIAATVSADQLHPRPGQHHVEHPGVGGVGQPQPYYFPDSGFQAQLRVAAGQKKIAKAAHGRITGLGGTERRDRAVFQQQVVQSQDEVAVGRGQ
jgi:hypothetical protein